MIEYSIQSRQWFYRRLQNDTFGRKVFDELQLSTGFISRQFSYLVGEPTDEHKENGKLKSTATTQLVNCITFSDGRTISYEYDAEERITKVTDSVDGVTEYTYDALGQLLTETVNDVVVNAMTYDNYGNILTKNGKAYTYADSVWKDKLTSFDGQAITYDAQGNPVTYLGHNLTWEKGRQLKSFDSITYTYNANGIRTSKTVNGVKHTYTLDGTKILREAWGNNTLIPLYDFEDSVCGIIYNGIPFYFLKNLQGDIIAIVDKDANLIAKYTYDAWGKVLSVTDKDGILITDTSHIALINPFRYRGYYYDEELGCYYLQSRYYDPITGRFVNADEAVFANFGDTCVCTNLISYCKNNAVNRIDNTGHYASALVLSSSLTAKLTGALPGIMTGISASMASIKTAIATSWFIAVCIAATAIAIVGIIYVVNNAKALMTSAKSVISALKTKVNKGGYDPKNLKDYTVYVIVRKNTIDVVYVGITKNYSSRKSQHTGPGKRFSKSKFTMMPIASNLTKTQARALEQIIITAYTLNTLVNMINSISPNKWKNFGSEFNQMNTLIQSWIDPE